MGLRSLFSRIKLAYLESKSSSVIEIVIAVIIELMTLSVLISDFYNLLRGVPQFIPISFISIIVAVLIVTTVWLFRKIREFRRELIERNKFIEFIVNKYDPEYNIKELHDTHEIYSDGKGIFSRSVILSYINKDVAWYEMAMGSTVQLPKGSAGGIFWAKSFPGDRILAKILYNKIDSKIYYAIILDPLLTRENPESGLRLYREWPHIWTNLVENRIDRGSFNAKYHIDHLTMKFIAPIRYQFTSFSINPRIGNYQIVNDDHGRSCIEFSAENVAINIYNYEIRTQIVLAD